MWRFNLATAVRFLLLFMFSVTSVTAILLFVVVIIVYVKVHLGCWNSTQSILAWLQVSLDDLRQSLKNLMLSWKLSTIVKYVCRLRARATRRRTSCSSGTTSSPGGTEKGSKSAKQSSLFLNTLTIPGLSPPWKPQPNRWSKRLLRWPSGATPSPTPTTSTTWTSGESCREYNRGQLSRDKYVIQLWTDASNPSDPTIKTVAENGFKMIFRQSRSSSPRLTSSALKCQSLLWMYM